MTRYITLAEYYWPAEQVTNIDATTLTNTSRSDLADSALHPPQAGYDEVEPGTTHSPTATNEPPGRLS